MYIYMALDSHLNQARSGIVSFLTGRIGTVYTFHERSYIIRAILGASPGWRNFKLLLSIDIFRRLYNSSSRTLDSEGDQWRDRGSDRRTCRRTHTYTHVYAHTHTNAHATRHTVYIRVKHSEALLRKQYSSLNRLKYFQAANLSSDFFLR